MGIVQKLVVDLARKVGLDAIEFEGEVAAIRFDDMILNFYVNEENTEIGLFMDMGAVPEDATDRLALYSGLLKMNNFGREIGGGVLGVDQHDQRVTFARFFLWSIWSRGSLSMWWRRFSIWPNRCATGLREKGSRRSISLPPLPVSCPAIRVRRWAA